MSTYKVSAIVAGYNVEEFIEECLDSLANQTLDGVEVIMVDDESPDDTGKIMDEYAEKYPNFRVVHQKNQGLSMVRNNGIGIAQGEYIAFVDGDDIVPEDAYEKMFQIISKSGSDMISGGVSRFSTLEKVYRSFLHKKAIKDTMVKTNIRENLDLIYDTTAWNKLYKKDFLNKHVIRYPEGMLYEDIPVELTCHLLANSVDVIEDTVYLWRRREGDNASITQQRSDMKNFLDRIKALKMCYQIIEEYAGNNQMQKRIKEALEFKYLDLDLLLFINPINSYTKEYIVKIREIVVQLLNNIDQAVVDQLITSKKLKYKMLLDNQIEQLKVICTWNANTFRQSRPQVNNGIRTVTYKKTSDLNHKPYSMVKTANSFVNRLENVEVANNLLTISGQMYVSQIDVKKNANVNAKVAVRNITNGAVLIVPVTTMLKSKHVTRKYGVKKASSINPFARVYSYDYAGYKCQIDLVDALKVLGHGRWKFEISYQIDEIIVSDVIGQPQKVEMPPYLFVNNDVLEFKTNHNWEFYVNCFQPLLNLEQATIDTDYLVLNFRTTENLALKEILLSKNNEERAEEKCELYRLGLNQVQAIVPLADKYNDASIWKIIPRINDVSLAANIFSKDALIDIKHGQANVILANDFLGTLSFISGSHTIELQEPPFFSEKECIIKVANLDYVDPILKIENNETGEVSYLQDGKYDNNNIQFSIPIVNKYGDRIIPLGANKVSLLVANETGKHDDHPIFVGNKLTEQAATSNVGRQSLIRVTQSEYSQLILESELTWSKYDNTPFKRKVIRRVLYPFMRLMPLSKKTVVFESYWGQSYSCSPKAMYLKLREKYPDYKFVWLFEDPNVFVDDSAIKVRRGSLRYYYYFARSKYFVENTNLPNSFAKRKHQVDVQTLHGTFLKTMGLDEPQFKTGAKSRQNAFLSRVENWDYLISSSDYQTKVSRSAFLYDKEVLTTGFPRNDVLYTKQDQIESIKERLRIPQNKKVLMYAPTFRTKADFNIELDINLLKEQLGDEYVLITRLHYFVAKGLNIDFDNDFVYDMSFYPTIEDLYLVTDILITDYSSLMFDFGHLRRPIIFFAYDLEEYVSDLRGIYIDDYQSMIPGPLAKNNQEVIEAIKNVHENVVQYKEKEQLFYDKFCQFGRDGKATEHVINSVFEGETVPGKNVHLLRKELSNIFKVNRWYPYLFDRIGRMSKKNIIIFESFFARNYSDSPRALYEYLKSNYPNYKMYWSVDKEYQDYFKKHNIPYITRFSYSGIFKFARAKFWVTNVRVPLWIKKPQGTKVVQTWHGTPLKTLGLDIQTMTMGGQNVEKYRKQIIKDTNKWDYLISPNHYSTEIFKSAFDMKESQIIETGYPRNDLLYSYTDEMVNNIKKRLKIPLDKKVVLYTPTWRDNEFTRFDEYSMALKVDLDLLRSKFSEEVFFLVRAHYLISDNLDLTDYADIALDVSGEEDISELYIIADCMITDYSSTFFDYANLKRPMIFFAYDLEAYASEIRGFYFDFTESAPGPIVQTNSELMDALSEALSDEYQWQYDDFYNRFCGIEDGHSSERVVDLVFKNEK